MKGHFGSGFKKTIKERNNSKILFGPIGR